MTSRDAVRASCTTKLWRDLVVNDELLWKRHLEKELGIFDKQGADGTSKSSSWEVYLSWRHAFSDEYWPFLGRAIKAWSKIKAWLGANAPDILVTIKQLGNSSRQAAASQLCSSRQAGNVLFDSLSCGSGLSEAQVADMEMVLGFSLPHALKVLYRLYDGQSLPCDAVVENRIRHRARARGGSGVAPAENLQAEINVDQDTMARSIFSGLFGGYAVYDHRVVSRLLPLRRAVLWREELLQAATAASRHCGGLREGMDRLLPLTASYNPSDKVVMADVVGGGVAVAKVVPGGFELREAAPKSDTEDGPLRWFEEYARRLADGWYEVCDMDEHHPQLSRVISLFPMKPPCLVEAVTQGVRVRASVVYVPEAKHQGRHLFAYSIRFSLLENAPLRRCQLTRRHWVIKPEPGEEETVDGEGVIGLFPVLEPGKPEFVYCSCTNQSTTHGSMEGRFQFVPGTIERPEGATFDVICPAFRLDVPEYIF
ncbi:hypothetical protein VOLCADRAFT_94568 [Volvox carteri f. nagariensis]|uniref:ApaG domain-containing protein n=1 Tax=Volvox carteri f. nagariensis TaxID=3068 RepID=D8U549_VOLCA|nr:uncharacterized protein VOLCADRAFT_94568 [Volvox carteri f. nagariensis]EFJ45155.1 hypothetical protein VOLCADRAFT_94568 [Volvox carteri f. nagariensis]|eukprot:XP_002953831.1 hypothetical protein VOLCADRAFT_94568 [Volvox carteri f. nagariensis]